MITKILNIILVVVLITLVGLFYVNKIDVSVERIKEQITRMNENLNQIEQQFDSIDENLNKMNNILQKDIENQDEIIRLLNRKIVIIRERIDELDVRMQEEIPILTPEELP